jgi:hypothetical protein
MWIFLAEMEKSSCLTFIASPHLSIQELFERRTLTPATAFNLRGLLSDNTAEVFHIEACIGTVARINLFLVHTAKLISRIVP